MTKLFALAFAAVSAVSCGAAAQTPATNPMPDGSRDMYVGLGVASKPRYEGAAGSERSALPVLQVQWSNGVFLSGLGAGIHLSRTPRIEYGPLLEVQPRRDESGDGEAAVGIDAPRFGLLTSAAPASRGNRLAGMPAIHTRLQAGGFVNAYLAPQWRLTSSLLYGAGNARHGARFDLGLQGLALQERAHHRVSLAAGMTFVNRSYNAAFFGVGEDESSMSGNPMYSPGGGLKDVHLGVRWNWAWSPSWMLTSQLQATRLTGDARRSPLVERPTNLTVSTAIAYRF
jgi:outer membrane protein